MKPTINNLVSQLVGMRACADHPITVLNPEPYFVIKEAKIDFDGEVSVRGERTCWFGANCVHVFPESTAQPSSGSQS